MIAHAPLAIGYPCTRRGWRHVMQRYHARSDWSRNVKCSLMICVLCMYAARGFTFLSRRRRRRWLSGLLIACWNYLAGLWECIATQNRHSLHPQRLHNFPPRNSCDAIFSIVLWFYQRQLKWVTVTLSCEWLSIEQSAFTAFTLVLACSDLASYINTSRTSLKF